MSNRLDDPDGQAERLTCAGLATVFSGCVCLLAVVARELGNPFFALTPPPAPFVLVPLAVVLAGTALVRPASAASAAADNLLAIRCLATGAFLLAPFAIWLPYVDRNVYFTSCSFLALLCLAGVMRQICEHVRQMFVVRRMHKRAVYAYRGKQFVHFFLLVPLTFSAVMLTFREYSYGIKSSFLAEIVWRNSPAPFRVLVVFSLLGGFVATLAVLAAAVLASPSPSNPVQPMEADASHE